MLSKNAPPSEKLSSDVPTNVKYTSSGKPASELKSTDKNCIKPSFTNISLVEPNG